MLVALAPVAVVLVLLVLRVPSVLAGMVGLLACAAGSAVAFPVSWASAVESGADIGPTMIEVAVILLGGVGLAQAMKLNGSSVARTSTNSVFGPPFSRCRSSSCRWSS